MDKKRQILQAFTLLALIATVMLSLVFFTAASAADKAEPIASWTDDFESYTPGPVFTDSFPFENWSHSGLKDSFVYTETADPYDQHLRMHGVPGACLGSVAYRDIGYYAHVEIEFSVKNTIDESRYVPLEGCHNKIGGLELSTELDVSGNHRGLLAFAYLDNKFQIRGGAFEVDEGDGSYLQDFSLNQTYRVKVVYDYDIGNNVVLNYYVDGVFKGSDTFSNPKPYEMLLDSVGLWAGQGGAYYDDVVVTVSEPIDINQAELSLTKEAPSRAGTGSSINYHLTVANSGPGNASTVVVTDTLPAGTTYVSATPSTGSCTENAGTVTCNLGTLNNGGTATVDIVVTAPDTVTTVTNVAEVGSELPDPDPSNNQDSVTVSVLALDAHIYLPIMIRE